MPRSRSGSAAESPAESDDWVAAQFNQVHSHIAVGTRAGWRIVACSPFAQVLQQSVEGGISSACMLFTSSLIALVGHGDRADGARRLRLWNTSNSSPVFELPFASAVLRVLMNKKRLLVVLEGATHLFELNTMRMLHTLESAPNPRGVAALCSDSDASICAVWPGGAAPGWQGKLVLFDGSHGHPLCTVAAHQSGISCAALDTRGELLATASEKGTVIRVHLVPNGGAGAGGDSGGLSSQLLYTLRRGTARATIHSLSFAVSGAEADHAAAAAAATAGDGASSGDAGGRPSASAEGAGGAGAASPHDRPLLCCASSTGTVHVWRLGVSRTHLRMARGLISAASPYKADAARDFARVKLKLAPGANWCAAAIYVGADAALPAAAAAGGGGAVDVTDGGSMRASASGCSLDGGASSAASLSEEDLGGGGGGGGATAAAAAAASRMALYVITQRGEFYSYRLDGKTGACTLQDERRFLDA